MAGLGGSSCYDFDNVGWCSALEPSCTIHFLECVRQRLYRRHREKHGSINLRKIFGQLSAYRILEVFRAPPQGENILRAWTPMELHGVCQSAKSLGNTFFV